MCRLKTLYDLKCFAAISACLIFMWDFGVFYCRCLSYKDLKKKPPIGWSNSPLGVVTAISIETLKSRE